VSHPTNDIERDRLTLSLLIEGTPEGLQRLITDHGPHVRAYLKRKLGGLLDPWQIEEAMGLAVQRAWQSSPRFEPTQGRLRAWFAVIARNCGLSLLAQQQGHPILPIEGIHPTILGIANGPSEARRMQMIVDVHRAITLLPEQQRNVLLADLNAGTTLPAAVLAERFQASIPEIHAARHCGQRTLRKQLEALGYGKVQDLPLHAKATPRKAPIEPHSEGL
jgi:DNA-directed RNA polymerase specialized sigma24 family protein